MAPVEISPRHGAAEPYLRPIEDLRETWPRILEAVDGLRMAPDLKFEDMTRHGRYLLGVHAAAAWCLGAGTRSPMGRVDRTVSFSAIAEEQALAEQVAGQVQGGWEDYATGVEFWMWWMTGLVPHLPLDEE